jgi:putative nucleotidyltransferase with HDIG domain
MTKVMVVDDEKSIRATVGEFLRREGYDVVTAEGPDAALGWLGDASIDIILSDIIMPGLSGVALLKEIQSKQPNAQVILMTGEPSVETAIDAVRMGANDYLMKPVVKQELITVVRKAANYKKLKDEKERLERENRQQLIDLERIEEERTGKLRQAMLNTAHAAATMLDLRDPYTAGHQNRVGKLAAAIGRELGLPDDTVEGLRLTGCVHDIGKITVPSDILNKPGKLSPPEYEIIKLHAEKGYEVFKSYEMPWPVAEIIYQHHERLNGSGYPRGLTNGEIMPDTRIISVADVVEAMMTNRPYRPKLGLKAALSEIRSNKGVLYDASAVDACTILFTEKGYTLD